MIRAILILFCLLFFLPLGLFYITDEPAAPIIGFFIGMIGIQYLTRNSDYTNNSHLE